MKLIPLRRRDGSARAYASVDDADYAWLAQWRWCLRENRHGRYAQRMSDDGRTTILMHRQIMGFPSALVDHRDGDGLHNWRDNLRVSTPARNSQNRRGADADNATGHRGVTRARGRRRFRAHATRNGVRHELGQHETAEAAAAAVRSFWQQFEEESA